MADRLSRDDAELIASCREEWLERALGERVVGGDGYAAAVATLFTAVGPAAPPPPVAWVSSPLEGARAVHALLHHENERWDLPSVGHWSGPEPLLDGARATLQALCDRSLGPVALGCIDDLLRRPLRRRLEPVRVWLETEVSRRLDRPGPLDAQVQLPTWPSKWHHAVAVGGSFCDIAEVAALDCARRLGVDFCELDPVLDACITLSDLGYWWPYRELTVMCQRPDVLRFDELGRVHAADGPAVAFGPYFRLYAWHGAMVPRRVVDGRFLDAARILSERNAELRRMMIERYGLARFRREARAERVHRDDWGTLWQVRVRGDEPVVSVEVVNATPEPDGSHHRYELRVPPRMRTALEAVAWTFGMTPEEYAGRMSFET